MANIPHRLKPKVWPSSWYSVSQVAAMVNRTRKTVLHDAGLGLLTGRWGEVRQRARHPRCKRSFTHVSQGWMFIGREVAQYIDYRFSCIGNKSVEWKRGLKPSAAELVAGGMTPEGAAKELGIQSRSVQKCVERATRKARKANT